MHVEKNSTLITKQSTIASEYLHRLVIVDCYLPKTVARPEGVSLLLINDGQNLHELGLREILNDLISAHLIEPILVVGIHAGDQRKMEYGTAHQLDYKGRGAKARAYTRFIFEELLPFIRSSYQIQSFKEKSFAGFSLGGLSALDIVWNFPHEFTKVGVFSGSLWWRTKSLENAYQEDMDRIMHSQIRDGGFYPWLKFFFETGLMDEIMDRNNNGIIDSVEDTLSLMDELEAKGYDRKKDMAYLELPDGRHDIATWAKAMPVFLRWGWGIKKQI